MHRHPTYDRLEAELQRRLEELQWHSLSRRMHARLERAAIDDVRQILIGLRDLDDLLVEVYLRPDAEAAPDAPGPPLLRGYWRTITRDEDEWYLEIEPEQAGGVRRLPAGSIRYIDVIDKVTRSAGGEPPAITLGGVPAEDPNAG